MIFSKVDLEGGMVWGVWIRTSDILTPLTYDVKYKPGSRDGMVWGVCVWIRTYDVKYKPVNFLVQLKA